MYLGALKAQRLSEKRDNQVNTYVAFGRRVFFFQERETSWCNYAGAGSESKL